VVDFVVHCNVLANFLEAFVVWPELTESKGINAQRITSTNLWVLGRKSCKTKDVTTQN
jgi:hypothetical protein